MNHKLPTIRQRLLAGTIWAFIGRVVMAFGGLGVSILVTRLLPQEDVGRYFLVFSMVSMTAIIGQMGMQILILKIASATLVNKSTEELRKLILSVNLVGVATCGIAGLALGYIGKPLFLQVFGILIPSSVMFVIALWAGLRGIQNLIGETFRGLHEIKLASFFGGATENILLATFLLVAWLLQANIGLSHAVFWAAIASGLGAFIAFFLLYKHFKFVSTDIGFPVSRFLAPALPMMITTAMSFGLNQADI